MSLLVKTISDGLESFLTSCVPYLDSDVLLIWGFVCCRDIIQANSSHMTLSKLLLGIPISSLIIKVNCYYIFKSEVLPTAPSPRMMI